MQRDDTELKKIESEFEDIYKSNLDFNSKIQKLNEKFFQYAKKFNLLADDRSLSIIRTNYSVFFEKIIENEFNNKTDLDKLKKITEENEILPNGFKSSIIVKIAFAKSKKYIFQNRN